MGWNLKLKANGSLCRSATVQLCACGDGFKVQFPDPFNTGQIAKTYTLTESGGVWIASDTVDSQTDLTTFDLIKDWLHCSAPYVIFGKTFNVSIEMSINNETQVRTVTVEITGQLNDVSPVVYTLGTSSTVETFASGTTFLLSVPNLSTPIRRVEWDWPYDEASVVTTPAVIPDNPAATTRVWRVHLFTYYAADPEGTFETFETVSVTRATSPVEAWRTFIYIFFSQGFWQTVSVNWDGSVIIDSWLNWFQYDQEGEPARTITNCYAELISET